MPLKHAAPSPQLASPISSGVLQGLLQPLIDESFNAVTVDSDTSTSDTCLVFATGRAPTDAINSPADPRAHAFAEALGDVLHDLAMLVVRDGEGATKLVTVRVEGAVSDTSAARIARSIADSPLVKTAIHGADPNWGRIVSAAGYAGVPLKEEDMSLVVNDFLLYQDGAPVAFDPKEVSSSLRDNRNVTINLTLKHGSGAVRFWTCDLTKEYVELNADYTT